MCRFHALSAVLRGAPVVFLRGVRRVCLTQGWSVLGGRDVGLTVGCDRR